jgi:hypothetical protein
MKTARYSLNFRSLTYRRTRRLEFDTISSNIFLRVRKGSRTALHQQYEDRNAGGRDGQKPLPDSRNKMNGVHVNAPLTDLIEQPTECAGGACTTNGVSDRPLRKPYRTISHILMLAGHHAILRLTARCAHPLRLTLGAPEDPQI